MGDFVRRDEMVDVFDAMHAVELGCYEHASGHAIRPSRRGV